MELRLHVAFNLVKLHCIDLAFQFNSFQCISVQLDNNSIDEPWLGLLFSSIGNPYVKTIAVPHAGFTKLMCSCQWWIQDFQEEGAPTPKVGAPTYYFDQFSPKTAWKWKKLDREGGARVPGAPPWIRQCLRWIEISLKSFYTTTWVLSIVFSKGLIFKEL